MTSRADTPQELREQIDVTRRELGATVQQLAAKTAVKARLHHQVEHVKDTAKDRVYEAKASVERRPATAAAIGGAAIVLVVGWTLTRRTD